MYKVNSSKPILSLKDSFNLFQKYLLLLYKVFKNRSNESILINLVLMKFVRKAVFEEV